MKPSAKPVRSACASVSIVAAVLLAGLAPAALAGQRPIRPAVGNWEGRGPLGLRLSFAFVRRGGSIAIAHLALGLPGGCRSTGTETWDAGMETKVEFLAPGTVLHGPFPPLGPHQFEFFFLPTKQQPLGGIYVGTFSNSRHGTLAIPSPTTYLCRHRKTAWPSMLHFALTATHRVRVADGVWNGVIDGPTGMSGTARITVIDQGRIETDFYSAFVCPPPSGGGGNFELGPLPTVGFLIAADGSIGGGRGGEAAWKGRFAPGGVITGSFPAPFCGGSVVAHFTAHRPGT